jgi:hypothetical protein
LCLNMLAAVDGQKAAGVGAASKFLPGAGPKADIT